MSTRLELPPTLLGGRRPPRPRADGEARSAILQLAQLCDRGECIEAAQQAVELLRTDVYDLRLACVCLVGVFVEQGAARLPELLRCTQRLVADEAAAPASMRSTPRVIDTTVQWLLQAWLTHIQFHTQRRDEVWAQWLHDGNDELAAALVQETSELARVLGEVVEQPASLAVLGRIERWAKGDLARALSTTAKETALASATASAATAAAEAPAPELTREPEEGREHDDDQHDDDQYDDGEHDDDQHDEHDDDPPGEAFEDHRPVFRPRTHPPFAAEPESPALCALRRKLHGFQQLVHRGDFAKAAIIANDVQRIIEQFDPVEFLPSLFAGYFRAMSQALDELRPHLDEPDDTPWQVLSRFYQADLDGFLEE